MDGYHIYPDPALGGKTPWPLIASSLWLRLGFVAATGAVVALTELYKGELNVLAALAWIFGGDFKDATAGDGHALHGEACCDGTGVVQVGDVEEDFVTGAARANVESAW